MEHPAGYSGPHKLYNYIKKYGSRNDITKKDVEEFLKSQAGHTYHGVVPRTFVRRPIKIARVGLTLGTDIADMNQYIWSHNNGYRYILILIDCFSRKVSLTPLKNKTCSNVARVLENYLENCKHDYVYIFSDEGSEYLGTQAKRVYDRFNIVRYSVKSRKFKCSIAERFIRTMKEKLYKYFSQNNTFKFIDVLDKFERRYNDTPHRGLCFKTPNTVHEMTDLNEVKKHEREQLIQKFRNYGSISLRESKKSVSRESGLKVGTFVRLLLNDAERIFAKSHENFFTQEIFIIRKIDTRPPVSYWLKDFKGRNIDGVVYRRELSSVLLPKRYNIERVVKTVKNPRTGKKRFLVQWQGFPEDFNSYVDKIYKI